MWIAPERRRGHRWIAPTFAVAAGLAIGVTLTVRGQMNAGLATLGVLLAYSLLLALRGGDSGHGTHDGYGGGRRSAAHVRAAAVTGDILVGVIVTAVLIQALRGAEIWIPAGFAGFACLTYLLSMAVLSQTY